MAQALELHAEHKTNDNTPAAWPSTSEPRILTVGDHLFREGEARNYVYRVETGVVAVFERRIGKPANIIAMAGPGDFVGLGCLEHHRDNARAVVESRLRFIPRSEFAQLAETDPQLRQMQDAAIKRDFEYGKLLTADRGRCSPIVCVSAFLVAISRQNKHEGRDATIVSDTFKGGLVADLLGLDIETLKRALCKLQRMGLVEAHQAGGLRLHNVAALTRVADGDLPNQESMIDALSEVVTVEAPSHREARLSPYRLFPMGATEPNFWGDELREATWLVSAVGVLSIVSVGLAVMFAFAVL